MEGERRGLWAGSQRNPASAPRKGAENGRGERKDESLVRLPDQILASLDF